MTSISNKDKARLRLADKRVEAWNRYRLTPAKNPDSPEKPIRCKHIVFAPGQDKESLAYPDKDVVVSDAVKMRSSSDKVARFMRRNGDNFSDYASEGPPPAIGASGKGKAYVYKPVNGLAIATPNQNSPFKRAKRAPVIVKV